VDLSFFTENPITSEPVVDVQTAEGDCTGGYLLGRGRRGRCLLDRSDCSTGNDRIVEVLVKRATTRVHEEVCDGRHFEAELFGDGRLHVLVRPASFLEDGEQSAALDVGEDQSRLLVDLVDGPVARAAVRQTSLVMLKGRRQLVLAQLTRYTRRHTN